MYTVLYTRACLIIIMSFSLSLRGVLESLVKRHFPSPSTGINWSLFENDPTLPMNRKKRKRGDNSNH